jgi:hypothetical protein
MTSLIQLMAFKVLGKPIKGRQLVIAVISEIETGTKQVPLLRTIPVEESIPLPDRYQFKTYNSVRKLVESAPGPIVVANCICRQTKDAAGQSCTNTDLRETCLQIAREP